MKEWGYEGQGISPIAASDPFPLLTKDAVKQVRRELFSHDILNNYQFASTFTKCQIRGYPKESVHSVPRRRLALTYDQNSTIYSFVMEEP